MLQAIRDLPDGVVGFEAIGEVTADDYKKVLVPAFEAAHGAHESVSLLYVLGSEFTGYGEGAEWQDAKFGMTHWSGWGRIAVVTDTEWVRHLLKVFGWMTPGEVRVFTVQELADAPRMGGRVIDIAVPYFVARPAADPPRPGVLVLMEGNGMSTQLLRVCQRLAHEGYLALAPDLFFRSGGSDPDKLPDQMLALAQSDDRMSDISAALDELRRLGASSVGITGFCMGGRLTYDVAVSGIDVQAAAPFYGARIGEVLAEPSCPLVAFFGGTDEWIPRDEIATIEAHHPGQVVVYEAAGHGFMRDGSDSYDPEAAADAWRRLLAFFADTLR